jgi:hypothetical protein
MRIYWRERELKIEKIPFFSNNFFCLFLGRPCCWTFGVSGISLPFQPFRQRFHSSSTSDRKNSFPASSSCVGRQYTTTCSDPAVAERLQPILFVHRADCADVRVAISLFFTEHTTGCCTKQPLDAGF